MNVRAAVARVAIAVAAVLVAVGGGTTARASVPAQAGASTAVVIVDTGSGVRQSVIHFDGSVSGYTALQLAGANPVSIAYGALGQAVCQLYGVGDAPVPSQCPGGWVYYRAVGGAGGWTQSSLGVSNTTVHDGDVEGWKYGGGQPPFSSYCAVVGCAPPPTNPPPPATQAAPPATAAPSPGPSTPSPAPAADGSTAAPTTAGGKEGAKAQGADVSGGDAPMTPGAAAVDGKDSKTDSTTTTSRSGTNTNDRRARSDTVEVAAGGSGGGSDGGSPIGVIVALAIVAAGVVGGLLLRRRRRGPAPG